MNSLVLACEDGVGWPVAAYLIAFLAFVAFLMWCITR